MTRTLNDWLDHQLALHPKSIEFGLERVGAVWRAMGAPRPAPIVITVGGTNGKGSSVAMLDSILRSAGYRVGTYTSPHVLRYNERVRVMDLDAPDAELIASFEHIESARGTTPLTFFECGTLAAFDLLHRANLDVAILEVGMGGRLDAVNLIDADCAVITTVDLDHQGFLGETREQIGFEKAGIMRAGFPVVIGEDHPPQSVIEHANLVGAVLVRAGVDFAFDIAGLHQLHGQSAFHLQNTTGYAIELRHTHREEIPLPSGEGARREGEGSIKPQSIKATTDSMAFEMGCLSNETVDSDTRAHDGTAPARTLSPAPLPVGEGLTNIDTNHSTGGERLWTWTHRDGTRYELPPPNLRAPVQVRNAAAVIACLHALRARLPVTQAHIVRGLTQVRVRGRIEILATNPTVILDVGHNPQAARSLRDWLQSNPIEGSTIAIFGALDDKDVAGVIAVMRDAIKHWCIVGLDSWSPRGMRLDAMNAQFVDVDLAVNDVSPFDDLSKAIERAKFLAGTNGRVLAFGSFVLAAKIMETLPKHGACVAE